MNTFRNYKIDGLHSETTEISLQQLVDLAHKTTKGFVEYKVGGKTRSADPRSIRRRMRRRVKKGLDAIAEVKLKNEKGEIIAFGYIADKEEYDRIVRC